MKRIIFGLTMALFFCTLLQAKHRTVTENDNLGNLKKVIELKDTTINGEVVTDTLSVMTYENSTSRHEDEDSDNSQKSYNSGFWDTISMDDNIAETIVAVTAIVFIFGLPLFVVFIVFFFRYKNRKAKYRLAEQALANGQPLPENFFKQSEVTNIHAKGIQNIFTGIGLFIFLWAITKNFGIGCIGLLIMFTGFGQLIIYYSQQKKNKEE